MDRKVIQQDRCFNARCHAMQSFRPCTYVCNTFEHVGGNMLECFNLSSTLTDGIFETGAYGVPSKSQNPTILGQGGLSSTQCSNHTWACSWHHPFGTNNYPPFRHSTQNQVFIFHYHLLSILANF